MKTFDAKSPTFPKNGRRGAFPKTAATGNEQIFLAAAAGVATIWGGGVIWVDRINPEGGGLLFGGGGGFGRRAGRAASNL